MPKVPMYTLAWSPVIETYQLYQTRDREALKIVPDSHAWFSWLDQVSSFAFTGKSGHFTARKEAKQRGNRYWSAYLVMGGHLIKRYLGKTPDITLARLEQIAGVLCAQREEQLPPPESSSTAGSDNKAYASQQRHSLHALLATKLHMPHPHTQLVRRAHLIERLQQGMECPLTLVSAPAGFGKTTLLSQWLATSDLPVAWLSLDPEDNDPTRFLSYLITALQTLDAHLGTTALALLRTPQPPPPETVLAMLTNDVTERVEGDIVLVLDDYHVLTAEPIQRGMTFLLEHLPPQLHLVLATRADPPLPLARLRAQRQLTEVRAADLRFDNAEASAFLQAVMELDLPPEAIATLHNHTEGWIAGLQLAALSLQGRTDVPAFLVAFSGSHRYVLDYLSDEVLSRQPTSVQQFLLRTCILDRLSEPLCDAVTDQEGSQAMLEVLERANLFVVAMDEQRRWYRYHHLFAEALRTRLKHAEPTLLPVLHQRASTWYEQHNLPIEAVQHALAIPDVELAARLIEPIVLPVAFQGQINTVLGWLHALPETVVRTRPFLCVYYARLLTLTNQLEESEARLQDAERGIQELPAEQSQIIMGYMLAIRGYITLLSGDIPQAVSLAHQALALLPPTEVVPRAGATSIMTRAFQASGDVTPTTEREIATSVAFVRSSDNLFATVSSICLLAWLFILQGRLRQAAATYEQVVQVVPQPEVLQTTPSSLFYYFGLGYLLLEWNDLDAAERHLVQGMALIKETLTMEPFVAVLGYSALARLQQARGNTREAFSVLDSLARLAGHRHFAPQLLAQGAAVKAQLELAQGNVAAAIRWAESSGISTKNEDLSYPRESQYLALARVRIAQIRDDPAALAEIAGHLRDVPRNRFAPPDGLRRSARRQQRRASEDRSQARNADKRGPRASEEVQALRVLQEELHLLDLLLRDAEAKARMSSVLEILVLRALALEAQGNRTHALSILEQALVLAAPEGYIRLFVDEGEPMLALLHQAHTHSRVPAYVSTLLSVFGEQHVSNLPSQLAEPLTKRERDVLLLLLEGASNHEIARNLILSVNTVKRHVYNLCGKLGVQNRSQAIVRAKDLNLL